MNLRLAMAFIVVCLSYSFDTSAAPLCLKPAQRVDNSWQNWYAYNGCGSEITVNFTKKESNGQISHEKSFLEPCKKTLIVQTFLSTEITINSYDWDRESINRSCSREADDSKHASSSRGNSTSKSADDELRKRLGEATLDADHKKADQADYTRSLDNFKAGETSDRNEANRKCVQNEVACDKACPAVGDGQTAVVRADGCRHVCHADANVCRADVLNDPDIKRRARESAQHAREALQHNLDVAGRNDRARREWENQQRQGTEQTGQSDREQRCAICADEQDCARFCD